MALKRNGEIALVDQKDRELDKFKVPYGGIILVEDAQAVKAGTILFQWDPHRTPILAEVPGIIRFVDITEGETVQTEELRTKTARGKAKDKEKDADAKIVERPVVIEHKGDKHPQIMIEDSKGKILDVHYLPAGARIEVVEGQEVQAGQLLAHQPRDHARNAGHHRRSARGTEVFEARKPKDPATMTEIERRD